MVFGLQIQYTKAMSLGTKLLFACAFLLLFSGIIKSIENAQAITLAPGDILRGDDSAVYYFGADNQRYVFPNAKTYFTWYKDFNDVQVVSNATLSTLPLGGTVTYHPGSRLLKLESSPKTYAVERGGVLRWLETESMAKSIYGTEWSSYVDDLPDSLLNAYTIGDPINDSSTYFKDAQFAYSRTINIDLGLKDGTYGVPETPVLNDPGDSVSKSTTITVSWSDIDNTIIYQFERDTNINFPNPKIKYTKAFSVTDSISADESTVFYYRVRAINAAGKSDWSNLENISLSFPLLPARPTLIDPGVSYNSGTPFNLGWQSSETTASFSVERDTSTAFDDAVTIYSGTSKAVAQTLTVSTDTTYYFRVRAKTNAGYSAWSTIVDIVILATE